MTIKLIKGIERDTYTIVGLSGWQTYIICSALSRHTGDYKTAKTILDAIRDSLRGNGSNDDLTALVRNIYRK